MKYFALLIFFGVAPILNADQNNYGNPAKTFISKPHIQYRIAEDNPGPGLKEMKTLTGETIYVSEKDVMVELHISSIHAWVNDAGVNYQILFNERGVKLFEKVTRENIKKRLAFFVDGKLLNAPVIMQTVKPTGPVAGGLNLPRAEAEKLAKKLNGE